MSSQQTTKIVQDLPLRLRNFFAKFPPEKYSALVRPPIQPPQQPEQTSASGSETQPQTQTAETSGASETPAESNQSQIQPSETTSTYTPPSYEDLPTPYTPNRDAKGTKATKHNPAIFSPSRALLYSNPEFPNPFLPRKNFVKGTWFGPRYGLRKQADLVKLAIRYNVEALLPPGKKSTEYKQTRKEERGLRVKGTGIGQKVKGKKWERTMEPRLEERRKAMVEMPRMVREWKQRGRGRGWKKYPKK